MRLRSAFAVVSLAALGAVAAVPLSASATAAPSTVVSNVAHLLADGTLDVTDFQQGTGFTVSAGGGGWVSAGHRMANGQLLAVGYFDTYNGTATPYGIVLLNEDGSIDQAFSDNVGSGASGFAERPMGVLVDDTENIYVLGKFTSWSGTTFGSARSLVKLNTDGTVDSGFIAGDYGVVWEGLELANGQLIVVGDHYMRKLNTDGSAAVTCSGGLTQLAGSIALAGDTVWIGRQGNVNRWDSTQSVCDDNTVHYVDHFSGLDMPWDLAIDDQGAVYLGGNFGGFGGLTRGNVAKLNPDETVSTEFELQDGGFSNAVQAIALDGNGHLLLGGIFTHPTFTMRPFASLARVDTTTGAFDDSLFNSSGVTGTIYDIEPDGNGGWYLLGGFTAFVGPSNAPPSITFDANGGEGTMSVQTGSGSAVIAENAFTRAGYVFAGWNTAPDGTGDAYDAGDSFDFSSAITLYAQWTASPSSAGGDGSGAASLASTGADGTRGFALMAPGALLLGAALVMLRRRMSR